MSAPTPAGSWWPVSEACQRLLNKLDSLSKLDFYRKMFGGDFGETLPAGVGSAALIQCGAGLLMSAQLRQLALPPGRYEPARACRLLFEACDAGGWAYLQEVLDVIEAVAATLDGTEQARLLWVYLDQRLDGRGRLLSKANEPEVYRRIRPNLDAAAEPGG